MLTLRAYRPDDAGKVAGWLVDEEVFLWWSAGKLGDYPLSPERLNAFYAPHIAQGDWFPQTMEDDGEVAGGMLMRWKERKSGWLHFGFIVVDGSKRGRGYGSGMLNLAFEHAFKTLGASRVTLNVFADNLPAIRCYERLGFARESERTINIGGRKMKVFRYEKKAQKA